MPQPPPPLPAPGPRPGPSAPTRLRRRSLADAALDSAALEVFKQDARSRVWRVEHATRGPVVVKRFEYQPLRQRAALALGLHPAQWELRQNARLRGAGVPAVPIQDAGVEPAGVGARVWLATPWSGKSMQTLLKQPGQTPDDVRALLAAAAGLTRRLIEVGYTFKDLKPSNLVIDGDGRAHLIDVGSARRDTAPAQVARMLAVMDRVMARDGVDEGGRQFFRERASDG